jgi:endonuclease YncB( thermonuclease family)
MNFIKRIQSSGLRRSVNTNNSSENIISSLNSLDTKNIKLFTLEGKQTYGIVSDIYDGDTCKIVFKLKDEFFKWNCRISGVDTPELRTKNLKEKECGYFVRDKLREKILNKVVKVNCMKFDKYGRLLVEIFIDDCNINTWLIENNYAYAYDGGTKSTIEWDIDNINK